MTSNQASDPERSEETEAEEARLEKTTQNLEVQEAILTKTQPASSISVPSAAYKDLFEQLIAFNSRLESVAPASTSPASTRIQDKNVVKEEANKLPLGFIQVFATLVFVSGIALGVYGSLKPEIVEIWEDGKPSRVERRIGTGDFITMAAGYSMAGLAAGTVFYSYAPGLMLSTVDVIGTALASAVGRLGLSSIRNQKNDEETESKQN